MANRKLTVEQVKEIKRRLVLAQEARKVLAENSLQGIAKDYDVVYQTIWGISTRERYFERQYRVEEFDDGR